MGTCKVIMTMCTIQIHRSFAVLLKAPGLKHIPVGHPIEMFGLLVYNTIRRFLIYFVLHDGGIMVILFYQAGMTVG